MLAQKVAPFNLQRVVWGDGARQGGTVGEAEGAGRTCMAAVAFASCTVISADRRNAFCACGEDRSGGRDAWGSAWGVCMGGLRGVLWAGSVWRGMRLAK